jgi:N-formylglutamate amidohydrolase
MRAIGLWKAAMMQADPDLTPDLTEAALPAPVEIRRWLPATSPLVFASPHSGQLYPAEFVAAARLGGARLRRSEDCFVDELFAAAPALGAPLVAAVYARAYCDPNREKWELDPAMFVAPLPDWVNTRSPRVASGLGTVARVVASGEAIYRGKLDFAEVSQRIEHCWQGFHDALETELRVTRALFGRAVLVDCHSMPANSQTRPDRADIVLGDAHGTSCAPRIVGFLEERLTAHGFRVRRNDPYAGGYITRHYGRPREDMHAVQIELCRSLYMHEASYSKSAAFEDVQARIRLVVAELIAAEQARSG